MYRDQSLVILDADGTTVDAFSAMQIAFQQNNMDIGDLVRFQKRRKIFKYLGGSKEFPRNLRSQMGRNRRAQLIDTLTEVYRNEGKLYPGIAELVQILIAQTRVQVGIVTRNVTREPLETLRQLFARHGVDTQALNFMLHLPLGESKTEHFRRLRHEAQINPARTYACGDEKVDYEAALGTGAHPFIAAYGFEDYERLIKKIGVPAEVIARTPTELSLRLLHALSLESTLSASTPKQPEAGGSSNADSEDDKQR